jgi:hypothetical protein
MHISCDKELIKKQVGRTRGDVWDRLYRLNRFMQSFRGHDGPTMDTPYEKLLARLARAEVKFGFVNRDQ